MLRSGSGEIASAGASSLSSPDATSNTVDLLMNSSAASGLSTDKVSDNPMFLGLRESHKERSKDKNDGIPVRKDTRSASGSFVEMNPTGKRRTSSGSEISKSNMKPSKSELSLVELKTQNLNASSSLLSVPLSSSVTFNRPGLSDARNSSYSRQPSSSSIPSSAPHSRKSSMSMPLTGPGFMSGLLSGSLSKLNSHSSSASTTDLNLNLNLNTSSGRSSIMEQQPTQKDDSNLVDKLEEMKDVLLYDVSFKIDNVQGSLDSYVGALEDRMKNLKLLNGDIQNKIDNFNKEFKQNQMESEMQIEKINLIQKDIEVIDGLYERLGKTKQKLAQYKERLANVSLRVEEQEMFDRKRHIRVRYVKRSIFVLTLLMLVLGIVIKNGGTTTALTAPFSNFFHRSNSPDVTIATSNSAASPHNIKPKLPDSLGDTFEDNLDDALEGIFNEQPELDSVSIS